MKKKLGLIIFIFVIVVLIVLSIVFSDSDDKYIQKISISDAVQKINNDDTFILYVMQDDCKFCNAFYPTFIEVLREYDLVAYAMDISNISDEDLQLYNEYFDISGTPTVLFYDKGDLSLINIEGSQTKDRVISKLEAAGFIDQE